jgi:hypothetical protein
VEVLDADSRELVRRKGSGNEGCCVAEVAVKFRGGLPVNSDPSPQLGAIMFFDKIRNEPQE